MDILVACEFSGIVRDAFRKQGHNAWSCDLLPTEIDGPHIRGDVRLYLLEGWDMMIAHPPCTHLAVSGAAWFKYKHKEQEEALAFVKTLMDAPIPRICIENPVSIISTRIRKPDQIIQPYQFGHPEAKKTCLWLKNLPLLTPTEIVEPVYVTYKSGKRMSLAFSKTGGSMKDRDKVRSKTFQGIANAMASQWGNLK